MSTVEPPNLLLGAMMRTVWQWMRDRIAAEVVASGHPQLTSAHLQVFRYPGPDGARPSVLAQRLQITKQSVNDLIGHLEQYGYLTRESDPLDGRARVVRLTRLGRELERTVNDAARGAEERVAEVLGSGRLATLRSTLRELCDALGADVVDGEASP